MTNSESNKLKETLQNFKLFYDHSPDMYASVSPDSASILYCNQTLLEKLQYKKSEIIGHPIFKLYHPESLERARKAFQEFVHTGKVKDKEMALVSKSGVKIEVSLNVNAIRNENNEIMFSLSSWRDISDLNNTKSKLETKIKELECIRSLNKLQSFKKLSEIDFLKQAALTINNSWLTDEHSGITIKYLNHTYKAGNTNSTSHIISEELHINNQIIGKLSFHLGEAAHLESHKNIYIDIRNIIIETITSKQIDQRLTILDSAIKSSTDCIAVADPEGYHLYHNKTFENNLGYSIEEVRKVGIKSFYKNKTLAKELLATLLAGQSWEGEANLIHKDGHIIPFHIKSEAIKNHENEIIGLYGIHIDLREKIKQEKEEKRRQKQALRIFDSIEDIVYVSDPDTFELLFTNKTLNKTIGLGKNLTGKLCYEALQGKSEPCEFCTNHQLFDQDLDDGPIIWEFQNLKNKHWYRCTDKKIKWFDGNWVRMEIASDITEVKKANIRLAESEERYQLAAAASNNGIWDWWVKENKVFYSDKWKAQLGYLPEELEDDFENWRINLHPEDHDRMVNAVQNFLKEPKDYFLEEFRLKHKNGSYRWINNKAAAVLNDKGEVIRMFGSHSDITEQRNTEETLGKIDRMYRNMIQNAPDGVVLINTEGQFIFASPSAYKMFGYTEEEILGLMPNDLTHPDEQNMVVNTINDLIINGNQTPPTIEYRFLHKNGSWQWIESTFSITTDQDGNFAIAINFRNINERKENEKQLIEAKKKAETANVHKNHFLANMSHEIRTPMNGVIGFADLLKQDDIDESSRKKFLNIIDKNAKQLLTLIDDIIDIAKIEADELKIIKSKFFLNELFLELKNVFDNIKSSKGKTNLEIKLSLPENTDYLQIYSDQARIRQILSNLIGNAIKFTEEGFIKFGYSIHKNNIEFHVEDTGRGIPEDKIDSIFERFQQVSLEDSTKYGGTGLGLAISKGLVQVLGGEIEVKSGSEKGTRFDFSIPIGIKNSNGNGNGIGKENAISKKNQLKGKTILLAEDDENIQFYYQTVFEIFGVHLIIAENGRRAIELFKKHPEIDLVLMDIRMPELNGYKATKQILAINTEAIIIAQTAYVMPDEKSKCLEVGCKDYLMKPVKKEELISKINEYL